jgi:hypothetical protein
LSSSFGDTSEADGSSWWRENNSRLSEILALDHNRGPYAESKVSPARGKPRKDLHGLSYALPFDWTARSETRSQLRERYEEKPHRRHDVRLADCEIKNEEETLASGISDRLILNRLRRGAEPQVRSVPPARTIAERNANLPHSQRVTKRYWPQSEAFRVSNLYPNGHEERQEHCGDTRIASWVHCIQRSCTQSVPKKGDQTWQNVGLCDKNLKRFLDEKQGDARNFFSLSNP